MSVADTPKTAAVIGAGWAGCSAAVALAQAGYKVTLFEAARTLGGRARAVDVHGKQVDNGQHILLGAYNETLRLLRTVGIDTAAALLNLPLQMRYPPAGNGMDFVAPRLPAPLHLAFALLRAKGLGRADKLSLARFSTTARWMDWQLHTDCSVTELLDRFDQTDRLIQLMWRPLCLAALNTPPERASAKVFLNVLRDSLGARRSASDMLLPRTDLSSLFPAAAAAFICARGGAVRTGAKVGAITRLAQGWQVSATGNDVDGTWNTHVDVAVMAGGAPSTAVLLGKLGLGDLATRLMAFEYEPITTCYLQYPFASVLDLPFYALLDDPAIGHWGQFVFDRGQLDANQAGMLSVVVSASSQAGALDRAALTAAVGAQLAAVFGRPELAHPQWSQVITEKRATFACTPGLERPGNDIGLTGLAIAGDYTASDYPATLEAAIRSGSDAAKTVQ
ncbi:MAG: hydroxysqualene dehydroxylase HpnE [Pseudomonadota bacterium]